MALRHSQSGFTLIEMIVVIAIIGLVSSILLFNYSDFSTNVSVRNLAQEVALSVRKAQTYATSVRAIDGTNGVTSTTYPGYGISFSSVPTAPDVNSPTAKQFIIFADSFTTPNDASAGTYNENPGATCGSLDPGNECLEQIGIRTSDTVEKVSVLYAGDTTEATLLNGRVEISFRRPSPDAIICAISGSKNCNVSYAKIGLRSAKGLQRTILVWNTGQISVQ